jgi:integrase
MSLVKRGNVWWDYVWIDGMRHAKSTGTGNRRKAEIIARRFRDELNDIRQRIPHQNIDMTLGALATRFIADGMSTPYSVDRLQHLLPFFADIPVRDINQSLARKYRQERCAQNPKLKPATVNRDLSVLRRVLNWGVEESILAANPLGRLRLERERRTKRPVMSVREERMLMAHAPLHLQRIIRCALDTGMRRGEILSERWEDIDFDHRILYVTHSKTPEGEMRMVPLTGRLTEMLQSFRKDRGIVFTYDGNAIKIVKTSWAASLRRAKLRHVRFHDLRHTANTRMMLAGVLQEVRREILGHTLRRSRDVNDRYTHIELTETRDAIRKLEAWLKDQECLLETGEGQPPTLQSSISNTTATEVNPDEQNEPQTPAA